MANTPVTLSGKILIHNTQKKTYYYFENSDSAKLSFKSRDSDEIIFNLHTWFNTKDELVGTEYLQNSDVENRRSLHFVLLNG